MKYGLIGKKLGHSFSKEIHELLADYKYALWEISEEKLAEFLARADFTAINVTMPYKQAVIPFLAEISPEAKAIGAVNTVVNRGGKLYGYNTDFYGITAAFAKMGITDLRGKKALVLGTGGTSLTARAALLALGAKTVFRVSRDPKDRDTITYEKAVSRHADADLIFNATPVGMYPRVEESPISLSPFFRLSFVFDAIYNPRRTRLLAEAEERGIPFTDGLYMLVAQAYRASELFLDTTLDEARLDRAYERVARNKQNVVLIGMPSSGKSTVGRALAEATGRPFVDLDEEIVRMAGKEITAIFAEEGEAAFRDMESEVLRRYAAGSGQIIATGGGAVLQEQNVKALRQNGLLCFLDRPLSELTPTADRPTASDRAAMEKRYAERLPIYRAVADRAFAVGKDFSFTVNAILKELCL